MSILRLKSGFTLMELMVYIALLGGIVLIAGKAFSDSSKMRVRTQSMLQASQTVGNVMTIVRQDIAQTGAKSAKKDPALIPEPGVMDEFENRYIDSVYMDHGKTAENFKDSSSYRIGQKRGPGVGDTLDTLIMRRLRYDNQGYYEAVEEVTWLVNSEQVLKRFCQSFNVVSADHEDPMCPSTNGDSVSIAENIHKFKVTPAKPSIADSLVSVLPSNDESVKSFKLVARFGDSIYEPLNAKPENGGTKVTLLGFYRNYNFDESNPGPITNPDEIRANQVFLADTGASSNAWSTQCHKVTLDPYVEYEISFSMPRPPDEDASRMFCPERDHMAVGFRYADGTNNGRKPEGLNDFLFYPPTVGDFSDTGLRKMRFTTNDTIKKVCLGLSFALFSPVASAGNINITGLKLRKIPSSNYEFANDACSTPCSNPSNFNPCCNPSVKKNVKAIKVELSINMNGEGGAETAIIPIPSNGPRD